MSDSKFAKMDRRVLIRWIVAASAMPALARRGLAADTTVAHGAAPKGYGKDPDLKNPVVPWPRTMTPRQLQLAAVLSDLILPGGADSAAPSAIGIAEFVDEWVSAPYPLQKGDRDVILPGLAWLDEESNGRWHRGFAEAGEQERRQILDPMAAQGGPSAQANTFFRRFRHVIVAGYYMTPEGFKDIGYVGNVALASYPAPSAKEISILEEKLRKLGV